MKNLEAATPIRPVEVLKSRFCVISPVTTNAFMVPFVGPLIYAASQRTMTLNFTARVGDKLISAEEKTSEDTALAKGSKLYGDVVRKALTSASGMTNK